MSAPSPSSTAASSRALMPARSPAKMAPARSASRPLAAEYPLATAAAATGGGEAGGSGKSSVRVVPFQSLPESAQEELGKELFDGPLLTMENVQKLADYMQWSFKFTKVSLLLPDFTKYRVVYDL